MDKKNRKGEKENGQMEKGEGQWAKGEIESTKGRRNGKTERLKGDRAIEKGEWALSKRGIRSPNYEMKANYLICKYCHHKNKNMIFLVGSINSRMRKIP